VNHDENRQTPSPLDPADWDGLRQQAHVMLDDMLNYLRDIRSRPVWQPAPDEVRQALHTGLPLEGATLDGLHQTFMQQILPYAVGNAHPGFMGWVQGGGTVVGMLAEMLAGGLNANVGGRNQMPVEVEREITRWMAALFGFPADASGVFVTGTSMANLLAVWIARVRLLGDDVRRNGVAMTHLAPVAYASAATHGSLEQAYDLAGFGTRILRRVPLDTDQTIDLHALQVMIEADRANGFYPFMLTGNAGTVDTGAIDPLDALARIAKDNNLWFHVDGALGAPSMMHPALAVKLRGIAEADSIAFDFHKWGQVPYDAGFILVRDAELHRRSFASPAAYLRREEAGLAGGSPWPCDFGPDLSRGFRALKTWFTIRHYGADALGASMHRCCMVAQHLAQRVATHPELALMAPVALNIVCLRYVCEDSDRINAEIAVAIQLSGMAAPSTTLINGKLAIRAAIVNHRTREGDVDQLFEAVLHWGRHYTGALS